MLSAILLMITLELGIFSQNVRKKVVCCVIINISPTNIFPTLLLYGRFYQNVRLFLAAVSNNELSKQELTGLLDVISDHGR